MQRSEDLHTLCASFTAEDERELSVEAGEPLVILRADPKWCRVPGWTLVLPATGDEGLVPSSWLRRLNAPAKVRAQPMTMYGLRRSPQMGTVSDSSPYSTL